MLQPNIEIPIAKYQLATILDDCFSDKEILTLTSRCGIDCPHDYTPQVSKARLVKTLTEAFFEQTLTKQAVNQCLLQKAQSAMCRIGYMNVEEIQAFLNHPAHLLEDGEFGEVVWALLLDSRPDVQHHGQKLLLEHEQFLAPDVCEEPPKESLQLEVSNQEEVSSRAESVIDNAQRFFNALAKTDSRAGSSLGEPSPSLPLEQGTQQQMPNLIERLRVAVDGLKQECTVVNNQNKNLELRIKQLSQENRTLKRQKEDQLQESERYQRQFQQQSEILKEKEDQHTVSEQQVQQLEQENQSLKQDYETLRAELHRVKVEKVELAMELKSVEDSVYRTQQIVEQMECDFRAQMTHLKNTNDTSKEALARTREKMTYLASQQNNPGNRGKYTSTDQPRVGVFVDVQNMFYAAKDRYAGRVDYIKLLDLIVGPRQLVVAYAYVVQIPEINQSGFLSLLEHNGYTIKSKDLRLRGDGTAKGDWDVGIAIDIVSMLEALDVIILASGDGDFCALAEMIKQQKKRVEVVAFEHNTSMDLQRIADQFFPIGDDLLI